MTEAETRPPSARELVRQWVIEAGEEEFSIRELCKRLNDLGYNVGAHDDVLFSHDIFWKTREALIAEGKNYISTRGARYRLATAAQTIAASDSHLKRGARQWGRAKNKIETITEGQEKELTPHERDGLHRRRDRLRLVSGAYAALAARKEPGDPPPPGPKKDPQVGK